MVNWSSWNPFAKAAPPTPPPLLSPLSPPPPPPAPPKNDLQRLLKQSVLPLTGSLFLLLSIRLSQRTIRKKTIRAPYYTPNNSPSLITGSPALDAFEALQLASLSVFSAAMVLVGGAGVALDVSNVHELRERFRQSQMGGEWEEGKRRAEEEWEEWVAGVLERKKAREAGRK